MPTIAFTYPSSGATVPVNKKAHGTGNMSFTSALPDLQGVETPVAESVATAPALQAVNKVVQVVVKDKDGTELGSYPGTTTSGNDNSYTWTMTGIFGPNLVGKKDCKVTVDLKNTINDATSLATRSVSPIEFVKASPGGDDPD